MVEKTKLNRSLFTPKPITLEIDNIRELSGNLSNDFTNIRRRYSVTDKADGFRALLYFNPDGQAYIIDTNMNIMKLDVPEIGELRNIVIDGEYVKQTKDGRTFNRYLCFDIYFKNIELEMIEKTSIEKRVQGISVSEDSESQESHMAPYITNNTGFSYRNPLQDNENKDRITVLQEVVEIMKTRGIDNVDVKEFYFSDYETDPMSIFKVSNRCFNTERPYKIDGLIYTPMDLRVGEKYLTEDNKEEYLLDINSLTGTWNSVFKWKPPIENSIDFFVEYKQFKGAQSQIRKINRKKVVSSSSPEYSDEINELCQEMNMEDNRKDGEIEYRVINLFVGGTENELKRRNDPCNPEMAKLPSYSNIVKILFDLILHRTEGDNIHEAYIPIHTKTAKGNILEDFWEIR